MIFCARRLARLVVPAAAALVGVVALAVLVLRAGRPPAATARTPDAGTLGDDDPGAPAAAAGDDERS